MKNLLYSLLFFTLFFYSSCGSEKQTGNETSTAEEKNTLDSVADTLEVKEKTPRKRLPKHTGSWIDQNLDNDFFYSEKVDEMVMKSAAKFEEPQEAMADYEFDFLKEKDLKKLNVREVIYYALAYPASFSQICAEGFYDSTAHIPKISGYIPFSFEPEEMSDIQWNEINRRRDSVIMVITEYMENHPEKIDVDYLRILKRLDAYEAFPVVMATASTKNLANYSFLLEFMHDNEVSALREMDFYERMYGEDSYSYNNSVEATPAVRKKIIQLAKGFYSDMDGD